MKRWLRNLYIIAITQFISVVALNASYPFLGYFVQELGVTNLDAAAVWTGIYNSVTALMVAVFAPIWGIVADRYGRKRMLERAMLGAAVTYCMMGFVQTPQQLLAVRVLHGSLTGSTAAATTLVATTTPRDRTGWALGLLQMAIYVGSSFGPLLGGLVANHFGFRPSYWITSSLLLLAGLGVVFLVREDFRPGDSSARGERNPGVRGLVALLRSSVLSVMIIVGIIVCVAEQSIRPVLPLFIQTLMPEGGRTASTAGSITAAQAVMAGIAAIYVGRQADKLGYRKVLLLSALGAGLALLPQAMVNDVWQLFILHALLGACIGGILPVVNAAIAWGADSKQQGAAYGLKTSADNLGRALGPMLGASVGAAYGFRSVFIATAGLYACVAVVAVAGLRNPADGQR